MTARQKVIRAHKALLNGSGKLPYFEGRGLTEVTIKGAWIGYEPDVLFRDYKGPAFTYPCIAKGGGLLGIHYKSEARNGEGKRSQKWGGYADDLPPKGHGKKPQDPAKVIPFGLETLGGLNPGSLVVLCCGEEDTLSVRQAGYLSVSQPGAGLLEPVYARKDGLTLLQAGATSVRMVEWPLDAPYGADVNGRLVEDPESFDRWLAEMIENAKSLRE